MDSGKSVEKPLFLLIRTCTRRYIHAICYAPLLSHKFKPSRPINGLFVRGPLTIFKGCLTYTCP